MQTAQTYLEVVSKRGERQLELCRVYRNLKNRELFLMAYGKLYANGGAMTPGVDPKDIVDAMSLKKIDEIIDLLDKGMYQWKPTRRIYIPKENGKQRPISIAGWKDKLLQEVIRMILSAYYEPQFSTASHGFRPGRGCHTALQKVLTTWHGVKWFIEGDIRACFDELEKERLLKIIGRRIKDDRLMKLLRDMLNAGYLEDWAYHPTYSGVPQGGVISPLLTNIYLNELDQYVAQTLIPEYTKGETRQVNPEYGRLKYERYEAKQRGDVETYRMTKRRMNQIPSGIPNDPEYRRLRYIRYADDTLLGFIGPREEAEEIKHKLAAFLTSIGLTLSEEKTLVNSVRAFLVMTLAWHKLTRNIPMDIEPLMGNQGYRCRLKW
jgi:group II intron reverse transcriptase/maturase